MTTAEKERPILFSSPMVRAILDGRKTQTRRVLKLQPAAAYSRLLGPEFYEPTVVDRDGEQRPGPPIFGVYSEDGEYGLKCPYEVGMRLWVRETWAPHYTGIKLLPTHYRADFPDNKDDALTANHAFDLMQWKPSIHMPRWASRITLEITDVRVQRVQEISDADCIREGIASLGPEHHTSIAKKEFAALWDSINGHRPGCAWKDNSWVWAISFKRITD